jgi:hypothetical protein
MAFRYDIAALCAVFTVALWLIYRRDRARTKIARAAYFDDCRSLFEHCRIVQEGTDFPVLDGRHRGHQFRLEPVVDHMAVRKLPSLWLKVSLLGALPIPGAVDFLARPQNTEFYSPSTSLPFSLRIPPEWPQHAVLRTDLEDRSLPVALLAPHIHIFKDPKVKELLVTSRGVRIVYQASQGERAYYLVLRQPEFGEPRLPSALALQLLEQAIAVYSSAAMMPGHGMRELAGGSNPKADET